MELFCTFKPNLPELKKYISYYYLDITDTANSENQYICYPHFNTTLSFYKSSCFHYQHQHTKIHAQKNAPHLKILTPLREEPLMVTQYGAKHKIAVVFEPLGLNHFIQASYSQISCSDPVIFTAFDQDIDLLLDQVFKETAIEHLTILLDHFFVSKLNRFKNIYLENALRLLHLPEQDFSVNTLAEHHLGISRKQLGRLFAQHLGTSPQKYRNIVRFRQAMNSKIFQDDVVSYTELAFKAQYADQSHFIKVCKQLTGCTPKAFFNRGKHLGLEDTFWIFTK